MKAIKMLLFFGIAVAASATSVTFTFGTQTINGTTITGLSENATTAQIDTYMNSVLSAAGCGGCTVSVTGAFADTTWTGDGHTTGPGSGSVSATLGNTNNVTGSNTNTTINSTLSTFLATTADGDAATDSQITMKFSGFTINGAASMSYEIFPNFSCTALNNVNCGGSGNPNQPDFKFEAGTNSTGTDPLVTSFGTNGIQLGVTPGTTNGNSNNSPDSGTETSPQFLGTWSGSLSGVNELDFVDWPATIGVDNLTVSWTTTTGQSSVPEPGSVLLFGTLIAGIAMRRKLRKTA